MAGGLSIHCVDVASGRVAAGLQVIVRRLGPDGEPLGEVLAEGVIGANGLLAHPALMSEAITPGGYEASFRVGDFYRAQGAPVPSPAFLEVVPYRFHIADARQHYHLPFKFTAWGFSLFRGGA
jgi:5-hydroxyisourate hydrolase-like protein (transthyretin family)